MPLIPNSSEAPASPNTPPAARRSLFDLVRSLLGRGFRQPEVDLLDEAVDRVLERHGIAPDRDDVRCVPTVPRIRRSGPCHQRITQVGEAGIALIKRFEGCARLRRDGLVEAYPDPATGHAPWTIGWGATRDGLHGPVGPRTVWTQQQCDERLVDDLARYAREVAAAIGDAPTTQGQFDALVSFHYNTGAIARATLTKKHRAGDQAGAVAEFARWNKAGGRVLKGLVRRRAEEAKLYAGV